MIYFTSDHHFGDTRMELFYRNFNSTQKMNECLRDEWNNVVSSEDTVYHLGDFAYTPEGLEWADQLNGRKILIRGNYDDQFDDKTLLKYFDKVHKIKFVKIRGEIVQLNHYPEMSSETNFNLVGHIHSLWKVQRNQINCGCDAWHYRPVSLDTIVFTMNAIRKHYDQNVFSGELFSNIKYASEKIKEELKDKL